jgi:hypothetical protein
MVHALHAFQEASIAIREEFHFLCLKAACEQANFDYAEIVK